MIIINDATRLFLYNSNARALQRNEPTTILIADRQKQPQTSIVRKAASSAMPVKVFVSVIFKALCIGDLLSRSFYSSGPRTALFIVLILTNPSAKEADTAHRNSAIFIRTNDSFIALDRIVRKRRHHLNKKNLPQFAKEKKFNHNSSRIGGTSVKRKYVFLLLVVVQRVFAFLPALPFVFKE